MAGNQEVDKLKLKPNERICYVCRQPVDIFKGSYIELAYQNQKMYTCAGQCHDVLLVTLKLKGLW